MTNTAMSIDQIHANSLLASTFNHPWEVLASPFLDVVQKRCVLATWASDAFAVEGKPWLRKIPGSTSEIRIGDILSAHSGHWTGMMDRQRNRDGCHCPTPPSTSGQLDRPHSNRSVCAVTFTCRR